ncbi:MAG TPA: DUF4870 domain-containing protein [Rhodanobacteraceae bacterium]|nr:DUF4870 domain-containing protein [Rhodanobacteraceae bacterium]
MSENDTVTPTPPPPSPPPPAAPLAPSESDERTWAMLGHISAFSAFITGLGCVLGPLIVWLVKRDTMPFAGEQALEALNFNITAIIAAVALGVFTLITLGIGALLTVPLAFVLFIGWFVLTIVAAVKANGGEHYRYPFSLRLIK